MFGTLLNTAGILIGSILGLTSKHRLTDSTQRLLKFVLGAAAVFVGLRLVWISLEGGPGSVLKQLAIAIVAMMLGRLTGRALRLQKLSNRLGQYAREQMAVAAGERRQRFNQGFTIGTVLFCAAPLAILGSVQDGLSHQWAALAVKACMDGLAAMAFASMFGWSVALSLVPVVAFQGTLTLLARLVAVHLQLAWVDSIHVVGGLLVFSVALVIWEVKKIKLADYLPSLAIAPLLTWLLN